MYGYVGSCRVLITDNQQINNVKTPVLENYNPTEFSPRVSNSALKRTGLELISRIRCANLKPG